jgi:cytochrome P450
MTTMDLYYDPYDYAIDADPYPIWKRLRDEAPVYWNEKHGFYALSRYDDVLNGLLDTESFASSHDILLEMISDEPYENPDDDHAGRPRAPGCASS